MKTKPLLLSLTLTLLNTFSVCLCQDVISTIGVTMNSIADENKQAQLIANSQTGGFNLILSDIKRIRVYEIDSSGKTIREFSREKPNQNLTILLGGITSNGITTVFLTSTNRSEITSISLGSADGMPKKLEFLSGKEKFLKSFEYNDQFYTLTLQKHTSILKIYKTSHDGNTESHGIDLSHFRFANSTGNSSLYSVLTDSINFTGGLTISKMRNTIPCITNEVVNGGKLYIENGKLILTLDNSIRRTTLITVNLSNFSFTLNSFQQPNTTCDEQYARSNSFLSNGNLYQVKFCNQEIHFQVYDTCSKTVIKRHLVLPQTFNLFRNTSISKLNTGNESVKPTISDQYASKNLDSAKVTLNKITKGQPVIFVTRQAGQNVVTIGGHIYIFYSTPRLSYEAGITYEYGWTNYFRTLLDSNFDHIEGKISKTAFDDLIEFNNSKNKEDLAELLFEWNNQYIMGYYDKKLQQYILVRFKEKV